MKRIFVFSFVLLVMVSACKKTSTTTSANPPVSALAAKMAGTYSTTVEYYTNYYTLPHVAETTYNVPLTIEAFDTVLKVKGKTLYFAGNLNDKNYLFNNKNYPEIYYSASIDTAFDTIQYIYTGNSGQANEFLYIYTGTK